MMMDQWEFSGIICIYVRICRQTVAKVRLFRVFFFGEEKTAEEVAFIPLFCGKKGERLGFGCTNMLKSPYFNGEEKRD
jgi:hypothetical protein